MSYHMVKHRVTGALYEIAYVTHSLAHNGDVYAAYRLSSYDGMPIGPRVWIAVNEFEPADVERISRMVATGDVK
jgi:hypothetical protein